MLCLEDVGRGGSIGTIDVHLPITSMSHNNIRYVHMPNCMASHFLFDKYAVALGMGM